MEIGSSSVRPERKVVERNRRIHLKRLYSQLYALLPQPPLATRGRRSVQVPDRLDASVNYIKFMQQRIESMKERKTHLLTQLKSSQSDHR
ncbi:uncharacterized protein LOC109846075 [Asparagus officinalis]|uniref:uncharacterized protein LOC109846075 n=1 Tax=Asparagus officinalis TaxID=4686 RepID=UPI00098DE856|nr:uncharacterized protein LOC109846075 [Asparagus officinalis]